MEIPGPALLFTPASRPDRFDKALALADAVILDLEDGVAPEDKVAARGAIIDAEFDPERVIVRVSAVGTADHDADLTALAQTDIRTIMVAKAAAPQRLARIDPRFRIIAQCETAAGILAAERVAALERVVALLWGVEDLIASLGGTSSRKKRGSYRDVARHARSHVLLAAAAAGIPAIDAVHLDIADLKGQRREAADAAAIGFIASACIHPSQVEVIREAYRPDPEAVDWADRLLAAAAGQRGAFGFEGRMIDEPVLQHARRILARSR